MELVAALSAAKREGRGEPLDKDVVDGH